MKDLIKPTPPRPHTSRVHRRQLLDQAAASSSRLVEGKFDVIGRIWSPIELNDAHPLDLEA
jgi:hypothetical protein